VIVVTHASPGGDEVEVTLRPGETISFGRGGGLDVDLELDYPGLSRRAGFIGLFSDGRVSITSYQTGGALEVRRANGMTANRLATGEACVVAPASYTVEVVGTKGPPLLLELRGGDSVPGPRRSGGPVLTEPAMQRQAVLGPARGQEWQTVLALGCVLARRSARSDGWAAPSTKQLAAAAAAWFGFVISDKWLSDRLDAALDQLHLPRDGTDKLPRLVSRALAGGLVSDDLLDEVERRYLALLGRP
jgi:hypothetical protein